MDELIVGSSACIEGIASDISFMNFNAESDIVSHHHYEPTDLSYDDTSCIGSYFEGMTTSNPCGDVASLQFDAVSQKLPHSETADAVPPLCQISKTASDRRKNLVIWDWDDTIFPTSCFKTKQDQKDPLFLFKLRTLASFTEEVFEALIALYGASNIVIVTNASANWIDDCLRTETVHSIYGHFRSLIEKKRIATISAADPSITKLHPKSPHKWKEVAFDRLFAEHFDRSNDAGQSEMRCITSIGDSLYEWNASDRASRWMARRVLNRLRLRPTPSIDDMIEQFKAIAARVEDFGATTDAIELDFCAPPSPQSSSSSQCSSSLSDLSTTSFV